MCAAYRAVQLAQQRGLSPAYVRAVIAHWDKHRPAWEPGELFLRLKRGRPDVAPDDPRGWQQPTGTFARLQRAEATAKRLDQRDRERAVQRAAEAREQMREAEHETLFGPALDALSAEQLHALASVALSDSVRSFLAGELARLPLRPGHARTLLLAHLASTEVANQSPLPTTEKILT